MKYGSVDLSRLKFRDDVSRTAVIVRGKCPPGACRTRRCTPALEDRRFWVQLRGLLFQ